MRTLPPAFRLNETGVDILSPQRHYYCPRCRGDLTNAIRLHILSCPAIAKALDEHIELSEHRIKES